VYEFFCCWDQQWFLFCFMYFIPLYFWIIILQNFVVFNFFSSLLVILSLIMYIYIIWNNGCNLKPQQKIKFNFFLISFFYTSLVLILWNNYKFFFTFSEKNLNNNMQMINYFRKYTLLFFRVCTKLFLYRLNYYTIVILCIFVTQQKWIVILYFLTLDTTIYFQ